MRVNEAKRQKIKQTFSVTDICIFTRFIVQQLSTHFSIQIRFDFSDRGTAWPIGLTTMLYLRDMTHTVGQSHVGTVFRTLWSPCWLGGYTQLQRQSLNSFQGRHTIQSCTTQIHFTWKLAFLCNGLGIKDKRHAAILSWMARYYFKRTLCVCVLRKKCKACRGQKSIAIRKSLFEFNCAF